MSNQDVDRELIKIAAAELGKNVLAGGDYVLVAMRAAYEMGYTEGAQQGFRKGYAAGHSEGHALGIENGREDGYERAVKFFRETLD
jgi:flagellar biosynthesis/type III secretory pathway protein FliH